MAVDDDHDSDARQRAFDAAEAPPRPLEGVPVETGIIRTDGEGGIQMSMAQAAELKRLARRVSLATAAIAMRKIDQQMTLGPGDHLSASEEALVVQEREDQEADEVLQKAKDQYERFIDQDLRIQRHSDAWIDLIGVVREADAAIESMKDVTASEPRHHQKQHSNHQNQQPHHLQQHPDRIPNQLANHNQQNHTPQSPTKAVHTTHEKAHEPHQQNHRPITPPKALRSTHEKTNEPHQQKHPLSPRKALHATDERTSEPPGHHSVSLGSGRSAAEKDQLRELFSGWADPNQASVADDFYNGLGTQQPPPRRASMLFHRRSLVKPYLPPEPSQQEEEYQAQQHHQPQTHQQQPQRQSQHSLQQQHQNFDQQHVHLPQKFERYESDYSESSESQQMQTTQYYHRSSVSAAPIKSCRTSVTSNHGQRHQDNNNNRASSTASSYKYSDSEDSYDSVLSIELIRPQKFVQVKHTITRVKMSKPAKIAPRTTPPASAHLSIPPSTEPMMATTTNTSAPRRTGDRANLTTNVPRSLHLEPLNIAHQTLRVPRRCKKANVPGGSANKTRTRMSPFEVYNILNHNINPSRPMTASHSAGGGGETQQTLYRGLGFVVVAPGVASIAADGDEDMESLPLTPRGLPQTSPVIDARRNTADEDDEDDLARRPSVRFATQVQILDDTQPNSPWHRTRERDDDDSENSDENGRTLEVVEAMERHVETFKTDSQDRYRAARTWPKTHVVPTASFIDKNVLDGEVKTIGDAYLYGLTLEEDDDDENESNEEDGDEQDSMIDFDAFTTLPELSLLTYGNMSTSTVKPSSRGGRSGGSDGGTWTTAATEKRVSTAPELRVSKVVATLRPTTAHSVASGRPGRIQQRRQKAITATVPEIEHTVDTNGARKDNETRTAKGSEEELSVSPAATTETFISYGMALPDPSHSTTNPPPPPPEGTTTRQHQHPPRPQKMLPDAKISRYRLRGRKKPMSEKRNVGEVELRLRMGYVAPMSARTIKPAVGRGGGKAVSVGVR